VQGSTTGKSYVEEAGYGACAVSGAILLIPVLWDVYKTITHKKGRLGRYGPIEYFARNPLRELTTAAK
jgi:hypothetical protein